MKRWIALFCTVIIAIIVWCSGVHDCIHLGWLKQESHYLQMMVETDYFWSSLLFIAVYITATFFFMPFVALLTVAGGFLFGTVGGALYSNIGATIGSIGAFLLVRYLIGSYIQKKYRDQLASFNRALASGQVSYLLAIHFIAIIPFPLINLLAALTHVPLWTFIWTTAVGILPGSLIYAFAGNQLTTIHSLKDIFSFNIMVAFVLLALLALLPLGIRWAKIRRMK